MHGKEKRDCVKGGRGVDRGGPRCGAWGFMLNRGGPECGAGERGLCKGLRRSDRGCW